MASLGSLAGAFSGQLCGPSGRWSGLRAAGASNPNVPVGAPNRRGRPCPVPLSIVPARDFRFPVAPSAHCKARPRMAGTAPPRFGPVNARRIPMGLVYLISLASPPAGAARLSLTPGHGFLPRG